MTFCESVSNDIVPHGLTFYICHIDIRSMQRNFSAVLVYSDLLKFQFSFICLTETWLCEHSCKSYGLENYDFVENHRKDKPGGGMGIFVKKNRYNFRNEMIYAYLMNT